MCVAARLARRGGGNLQLHHRHTLNLGRAAGGPTLEQSLDDLVEQRVRLGSVTGDVHQQNQRVLLLTLPRLFLPRGLSRRLAGRYDLRRVLPRRLGLPRRHFRRRCDGLFRGHGVPGLGYRHANLAPVDPFEVCPLNADAGAGSVEPRRDLTPQVLNKRLHLRIADQVPQLGRVPPVPQLTQVGNGHVALRDVGKQGRGRRSCRGTYGRPEPRDRRDDKKNGKVRGEFTGHSGSPSSDRNGLHFGGGNWRTPTSEECGRLLLYRHRIHRLNTFELCRMSRLPDPHIHGQPERAQRWGGAGFAGVQFGFESWAKLRRRIHPRPDLVRTVVQNAVARALARNYSLTGRH